MDPLRRITALVVDDDRDMCRILEIALASVGCAAITVESAKRAVAVFAEQAFAFAFVDARLPDMDGWLLIEELRHLRPETRIIMISGYYFEDDVCVVEAVQASRIHGFLAKPFRVEAILAMARTRG